MCAALFLAFSTKSKKLARPPHRFSAISSTGTPPSTACSSALLKAFNNQPRPPSPDLFCTGAALVFDVASIFSLVSGFKAASICCLIPGLSSLLAPTAALSSASACFSAAFRSFVDTLSVLSFLE